MLRHAVGITRSFSTFSEVAQHLAPAVAKFNEIIAERASGSEVWDTDGKRYLDFTSGIGVTSTGHSHPKIVKAIQEQASKLLFAQQNILPVTPATVNLVDHLRRIVPDTLTRFFFCNSGSEAVDNAMKLARAHTGRQNIITFQGGYHGRTYGAMSITTSKPVYRQFFGPLPSGIAVAPFPYCLHCKVSSRSPELHESCCGVPLDELRMLFKMQIHPRETAAMIIEPVMGEGGFLVPPPGYLSALRKLCDEHDILLIFDEVQAGAGRTGTWWSHQQLTDAQPDLMIFAKGIASGFPFAGLAVRDHLFDKLDPGTMGGTYGGSAVGCAAASATIEVIEEEKLMENAKNRGAQLIDALNSMKSKGLPILEVRGRGLMVAAELDAKKPGIAAAITKSAAKKGLLLVTCGARETVRFLPPLVISRQEVDEAIQIFEETLKEQAE